MSQDGKLNKQTIKKEETTATEIKEETPLEESNEDQEATQGKRNLEDSSSKGRPKKKRKTVTQAIPKNALQLLHELRKGVEFVEIKEGDIHSHIFYSKCTIDGKEYCGQGPKKRKARLACAELVMKDIAPEMLEEQKRIFESQGSQPVQEEKDVADNKDDDSPKSDDGEGNKNQKPKEKKIEVAGKNPVMLLYELHPKAAFEELESYGVASETFRMKLVINDKTYIGSGRSKKSAKLEAAKVGLCEQNGLTINAATGCFIGPDSEKKTDSMAEKPKEKKAGGAKDTSGSEQAPEHINLWTDISKEVLEPGEDDIGPACLVNIYFPGATYDVDVDPNKDSTQSKGYLATTTINNESYEAFGTTKKLARHNCAARVLQKMKASGQLTLIKSAREMKKLEKRSRGRGGRGTGRSYVGTELNEFQYGGTMGNFVKQDTPYVYRDPNTPSFMAKGEQMLKGINRIGNDSRGKRRPFGGAGVMGGMGGAGRGMLADGGRDKMIGPKQPLLDSSNRGVLRGGVRNAGRNRGGRQPAGGTRGANSYRGGLTSDFKQNNKFGLMTTGNSYTDKPQYNSAPYPSSNSYSSYATNDFGSGGASDNYAGGSSYGNTTNTGYDYGNNSTNTYNNYNQQQQSNVGNNYGNDNNDYVPDTNQNDSNYYNQPQDTSNYDPPASNRGAGQISRGQQHQQYSRNNYRSNFTSDMGYTGQQSSNDYNAPDSTGQQQQNYSSDAGYGGGDSGNNYSNQPPQQQPQQQQHQQQQWTPGNIGTQISTNYGSSDSYNYPAGNRSNYGGQQQTSYDTSASGTGYDTSGPVAGYDTSGPGVGYDTSGPGAGYDTSGPGAGIGSSGPVSGGVDYGNTSGRGGYGKGAANDYYRADYGTGMAQSTGYNWQ